MLQELKMIICFVKATVKWSERSLVGRFG